MNSTYVRKDLEPAGPRGEGACSRSEAKPP